MHIVNKMMKRVKKQNSLREKVLLKHQNNTAKSAPDTKVYGLVVVYL